MFSRMQAGSELNGRLIKAVENLKRRDEASAETQRLILDFGDSIADEIALLDADARSVIRLRLYASVRGLLTAPHEKFMVEQLPAFDMDDFEVRPFATALYLEVFSGTLDRFYFEIRSNPGLVVSALVGGQDRYVAFYPVSFHAEEFRTVYGIRKSSDSIVLVRSDKEGHLSDWLSAKAFLALFLNCVESAAYRQANFNMGLRDRHS